MPPVEGSGGHVASRMLVWRPHPQEVTAMSIREQIDRRAFLRTSSLVAGAAMAGPLLGVNRVFAAEDEWVSLFNGKDLEGWHLNPERIWHGTGGNWRVEDGAIVGEQDPPGSGNGGILLTDSVYGDFELALELNPSWGIDSGLFVRATDKGEGFQVMVDYLNGGSVGFLYGEQIGGFGARRFSLVGETDDEGRLVSLTGRPNNAYDESPLTYAATAEEWLGAWRIGEWNTMVVRVQGAIPSIETWINDVRMMHFDAATFENPRYDRDAVVKALGDRGRIALQVHGGADRWPTGAQTRWRNIRIRSL